MRDSEWAMFVAVYNATWRRDTLDRDAAAIWQAKLGGVDSDVLLRVVEEIAAESSFAPNWSQLLSRCGVVTNGGNPTFEGFLAEAPVVSRTVVGGIRSAKPEDWSHPVFASFAAVHGAMWATMPDPSWGGAAQAEATVRAQLRDLFSQHAGRRHDEELRLGIGAGESTLEPISVALASVLPSGEQRLRR